jgi:16S rRNA (cytosine967-C5)-methyltransferase
VSGVFLSVFHGDPMMPAPLPDRDLALALLCAWQESGVPPMETESWEAAPALTRELTLTCIRHLSTLDAWIDHLSRTPPKEPVRMALRIGLAQLFLLDGIAEHAAVHETVEAAKRAPIPKGAIGFVNALLRRAGREREALLEWMSRQPPAVQFSHPPFLVNRWIQAFGEESTRSLCTWNQQRARTYARFTRYGSRPLPENGTEWEPHPGFPGFIRVPRGFAVTRLPGFADGDWYIQDPSTSVAPDLLAVQPGERVLDACAAPGGKTALLAEKLGDQSAKLLACDPNPSRIQRLRANLHRLGHTDVDVQETDLPGLAATQPELFDAVLLDVPCSNTGVLQRRPDAKWRLRKKELSRLTGLQYNILQDAATLVKSGGRIVYSTCSIEPEETSVRLLPGERDCDGCFAALIMKS